MDNNALDKVPDFGIQDTLDVGAIGDTDLIKGLIEPETSTTDPDNLTSVEDEEVDKKAPSTTEEEENKEENKEEESSLTDFLLNDDDEEEKEEAEESTEGAQDASQEGAQESSKKGEDEKQEESSIAFDALSNELANLGVFNRMQGEEENINVSSPEEFLERFRIEKQQAANQMVADFIGQFGQEYQDAFQAIYVKGVDPNTYFTTQTKIEKFKDMDMGKESNQEKVVRQMLINQGFDTDDIDNEVEKLKNYGDLEDTSKRYHKVLLKKEAKSLEEKANLAQQQQQQKVAIKQQYVENVREILTEKIKEKNFDGIPVNMNIANELQDFLLVDKWKTESGETLTDFDRTILELKRPENHSNKVKIALLLKLLEKDPTLSTIQKSGLSKKSSQLFKDVARQKTTAKRASSANKSEPASSWFKQ